MRNCFLISAAAIWPVWIGPKFRSGKENIRRRCARRDLGQGLTSCCLRTIEPRHVHRPPSKGQVLSCLSSRNE